jgi:hypothetical protein
VKIDSFTLAYSFFIFYLALAYILNELALCMATYECWNNLYLLRVKLSKSPNHLSDQDRQCDKESLERLNKKEAGFIYGIWSCETIPWFGPYRK